MFTLDDNFLASLGLGDMPADEKTAFLEHLYSELELRVGTALATNLTDDQLGEFERLVQGNNQEKVFEWLEANCPNYKDVVAVEMEKLRQEILAGKDQILAA